MDHDKPVYRSYLLRLWLSGRGAGAVWRASLEHPSTGERIGFSSLARLFEFLRRECGEEPEER